MIGLWYYAPDWLADEGVIQIVTEVEEEDESP